LSQPDYCVISGVELVSMYLSLPGLVRIKENPPKRAGRKDGRLTEDARESGAGIRDRRTQRGTSAAFFLQHAEAGREVAADGGVEVGLGPWSAAAQRFNPPG
jgi:hypothetical protein